MNAKNIVYCDSFGAEHILKEIKNFIRNKNIIANIYRYLCIGFIYFMSKGNSLLDSKNLFSPNDYEKNDKIILKYFQ